ncbi:MAG: hypothetical protein QY312_02260 [Candidatus Dojkabacteria bacterium]|nr:MAG: hypothetical protein QY312_02260 [Candidatus Dojkabacteria bacterium]
MNKFITNVIMSLLEYVREVVIPSVSAVSWVPENAAGLEANELIKRVINVILIIVVIAAVIFIMFAGIQYVSSQGDATKAKTAMSSITNAIIGLIVAFAAYALVTLVMNQIGVEITDVPETPVT